MKSSYRFSIYELLTLHDHYTNLPCYAWYKMSKDGNLQRMPDVALIYCNLLDKNVKIVKRIERGQHYQKKFPILQWSNEL